jgi:hypothetical protein
MSGIVKVDPARIEQLRDGTIALLLIQRRRPLRAWERVALDER